MSKLEIVTVFGQIVGLASTILMIWVFFNEVVHGHGVYFYETDVPLATGELVAAVVGFAIQIIVFVAFTAFAGPAKKDAQEPYGQPKTDRAYA